VLGGLGYAAYAAANAFMDRFAETHTRTSGTPWLSVDWDPWPAQTKHYQQATSLDRYAMSVAECREAFRRAAVSALEGCLLVATGDLSARRHQWIAQMASTQPRPRPSSERPRLQSAYVAPRDDTERALAELWHETLGLDRVGVNDNFFDLDGHSLSAVRLVNRVRQTLHAEIPVQDFFAHPTIAAMAAAVRDQTAGERERDREEQLALLNMVSQLSEEELAAQLDQS
jgi:acyl carrier protein